MRRAVNFRPAVFIAGGLIFGILLSYFIAFNNVVAAVAVSVLCAAFFVLFVFFSSTALKGGAKAVCFIVFAAVTALGGLGFSNILNRYETADLGGHILNVTGRVKESYYVDGCCYAVLDGVSVDGAVSGNSAYKISAVIYGDEFYKAGTIIGFRKAMLDKTAFYGGKFAATSVAENIKYYVTLNSSEVEEKGYSPDVFQRCNLFIFDVLKAGMSEQTFPVAYAMLTGNSDYMSEEVISAYRTAGVAHIFAVSGLHVGILAAGIFFVLKKLKVRALPSFCAAALICLFYSGISGFSASSLRALTMFCLLNFAKLIGLKYDGVSALFAAAGILLLFSPAQLFCAGFQLSFLVVLSVIILSAPLSRAFKFLPKKVRFAVSVALSAEIGGVPVMLYSFGNFASLAVLTNALFVPIVGVIFVGLIACVVLGGIFSPAVFLFLPDVLLSAMNSVFTFFNFGVFLIGGITLGIYSVAYYAAMAVGGGLFNVKGGLKAALCVFLAVVCATGTFAKTVREQNTVYADVTGSERFCAVLLRGKGDNLLIVIEDSGYYSLSGLGNMVSNSGNGRVTAVFMNELAGGDIQTRTTRLKTFCNVQSVYYLGEEDADMEEMMELSFPEITVFHAGDGDEVVFADGKGKICGGGRCFYLSAGGADMAVFTALGEDGVYDLPDIYPKTIVGLDGLNELKTKYSPQRIYSFRRGQFYENGEENKCLTITL